MKLLGSLTNRIFLASAALAVVSIGAAVYFVSLTTTRQAEAELQRGLIEAGALVDQQTAGLVQTLTVMARLVADSPKFKAAVDTDDPPTVQPIAVDYQKQLGSALVVVTNGKGDVLATAGPLDVPRDSIGRLPEIKNALAGKENSGFWGQSDGALQVVSVPIAIGIDRPELMGTLTVGFRLDDALAEQFKRETQSDIAFAVDGQIKASTLPDRARLASLLAVDSVQTISVGGSEYVALRRPLAPASANASRAPTVLLLRSRTERLRFLNAIHTGLAAMALLAVFAATILSYAVARTITRPLADITGAMREMASTGDLTRKISLRRSEDWEDEDAKLLAATFNTLTDSIERFQREAAQRERLSALGRLSTVVAHEIRNPLMIIKASLRTLAKDQVSRDEIRQTLKDVDEEVARLNRVVNDVLDFARPIRFDYAPADVNAICADAEQATREGAEVMTVTLNPDETLKPVVTDAERLRMALVNILENARHAVAARPAGAPRSDPDIEIHTRNGTAGHVSIIIRDRGVGVKPEDLPRVFDPYFTTKRTGSGLGLGIAKNIVEGMGGTIALDSQPGRGTEIIIDLPSRGHNK
ncbi:MAG: ATP-binding protein [Vicinamibacterales bacterium]|nr:ATP-binding protein [Vicinamibacterales bacterium]